MNRKTLTALIVLIIIALLAGLVSSRQMPKQGAVEGQKAGPYEVTVMGKMVCLPRKDTTGMGTLECAYGLQTPDGSYYALEMSAITESINEAMSDNNILVSGSFTPLEEMNTDAWQQYNIQGMIQATSIDVVEAAEPSL